VVRPGAFAHPLELGHDDLGGLDYRVPQNTWISGGAVGSMPFSRLGLVAGSGHEQSNQLLDLGGKGELLRYAVDELGRLGNYRFYTAGDVAEACAQTERRFTIFGL